MEYSAAWRTAAAANAFSASPRGFSGVSMANALLALGVQIGDVRLLLVLDPDQRGGDTRGFPIFSQHQRDRLSAEKDPVIVKRAIGRAFLGRDIVLVGVVLVGHRRPIRDG